MVPFTLLSNQLSDKSKPTFKTTVEQEPIIGPSLSSNIIFKSTNGGETWQDLSLGLPQNIEADIFFASETELYLSDANGTYQSKPNSKAPYWNSEHIISQRGRITNVEAGIIAFNYDGQFLQKKTGTDSWLPIYTNFKEGSVQTIFETSSGTVLIGCDNALFKSADKGKTWKQVHNDGWVMELVELNGVIIATGHRGIMRSTDDGENWNWVISEGGVGIDVATIDGGFAAITYSTESLTRRMRTSYDNGLTWQPIDTDLPSQASVSSILQVGTYFFCGHPDGVMRSSDKGASWQNIFPAIEEKVFNLYVSGDVIYAIPRSWGC